MCPSELQNEVYELYHQSNSVMLDKLTVKHMQTFSTMPRHGEEVQTK